MEWVFLIFFKIKVLFIIYLYKLIQMIFSLISNFRFLKLAHMDQVIVLTFLHSYSRLNQLLLHLPMFCMIWYSLQIRLASLFSTEICIFSSFLISFAVSIKFNQIMKHGQRSDIRTIDLQLLQGLNVLQISLCYHMNLLLLAI